MKFSTTAVVSLLFVVVAGAYYFLNPRDSDISGGGAGLVPAQSGGRPQGAPLLPLTDEEKIGRIEIQDAEKKQTLVLEKKNGKWRLASPVSYAADPVVSEGLETALLLSTKARRLAREKEWSEYGLENPPFKIGVGITATPTLTLPLQDEGGGRGGGKGDIRMRVLYLGDISPVAEQIYARWEGEEEYFLVDAALKAAFDKSVYSLREKRIFRQPLGDVAKIHVKTFSGDYELAREKDVWYWLEPIAILGEPAAEEKVAGILEAVSGLYIKDFLDGTKKGEREFGLGSTGSSISLWGKGMDPEILLVGREAPPRDGFFAKRQDENIFFLVASGNLRNFFQTVEKSIPHPNPPPAG